jgi:membrane protease YdiL (CAAX protease family)
LDRHDVGDFCFAGIFFNRTMIFTGNFATKAAESNLVSVLDACKNPKYHCKFLTHQLWVDLGAHKADLAEVRDSIEAQSQGAMQFSGFNEKTSLAILPENAALFGMPSVVLATLCMLLIWPPTAIAKVRVFWSMACVGAGVSLAAVVIWCYQAFFGNALQVEWAHSALLMAALLAAQGGAEELFFRDIALQPFETRNIEVFGWFWSWLVFVALHIAQVQVSANANLCVLPVAVLGLVALWLRIKSGNVIYSVIFHASYNASAVLLLAWR